MNAKRFIFPLVAFLPLCGHAAPPHPTATVIVNCAYAHWPSRDVVARNLQLPRVSVGEPRALQVPAQPGAPAAASDVGRLQLQIRREGRRHCLEGASHVQVEFFAPRGRGVAQVTAVRPSPQG